MWASFHLRNIDVKFFRWVAVGFLRKQRLENEANFSGKTTLLNIPT